MQESVRWLISKGDFDRSEKILRRIAKVNGKEVSEDVYKSFRVIEYS